MRNDLFFYIFFFFIIFRLRAHACSSSAAVSNIKTSTVKINEARAKSVQSAEVYGAKELHDKINDSVASLDETDLSSKRFNGSVQIENLLISNFEDSPFWSKYNKICCTDRFIC